ncbi:MAG: zinc-binding dehydrogenase [bacterium]|nr:zinc-binding dehydrogenase [bacterium]
MKAAVCHQFGVPLTVEDVTIVDPSANEVRVVLSASAICHSDIAYMDGDWGGQLPTVYGHEASGIVTEVGAGVTTVHPGDAVVVTLVRSCGRCFFCLSGNDVMCETEFGLDSAKVLRSGSGEVVNHGLRTAAFAEEVLVHESQLAAIPGEMSMAAAALLACGVVTGFGAVTRTARVPEGANVVVVGVGGVGLNCIQGATHSRAAQVIAVDLREDKLTTAEAFGATSVVNASQENAPQAVSDATAGRGADYVFITAGTAAAVEQSMPMVRRGGTLVVVGMPPTGDMAAIDTGNLAGNGQTILGSKVGSARVADDIPKLARMYQDGLLKLDELVSNTFSLDQINDAIDSARSGKAVRNVIMFDR